VRAVSGVHWQRLSLRLGARDVDKAEALLELAGAVALSFDDAEHSPIFEPPRGETPLWPSVSVHALYPSDFDLRPLRDVLIDACGAENAAIEPLADADWQAALLRVPAPRRFGRLEVVDAAASGEPAAGLARVRLPMGVAFGTGEHPTTALCLEWLEANLRHGATVLDYGCGSGVLALAALALGASAAWAVDDDPQARLAAAQNAELNGMRTRLWVGAPEELPSLSADVVIANILAGTLESLAPTLESRARDALVLSGILPGQAARVCASYAARFEGFCTVERDGWMRIAARRIPR
jgi:ribosomal protein L11 methyltransferase